eukprot:CAMPEP_0184049592 /NCGR_PEP_ID=MMETSP0956-20121227/3520_1 /TAXON_ID=627963 /ORGANISM="Aplanochytrium sp, Strain PBS07" /LENGTH=416 /DNA_ID=CAMNT_0026341949 /DNA_START=138 /DNA_END=1387 /DNA_ORIENTATION=-
MTQQGVQKGRFWVTDPANGSGDNPEEPSAVSPVEAKAENTAEENVNPTSGQAATKSYKQGRFLVTEKDTKSQNPKLSSDGVAMDEERLQRQLRVPRDEPVSVNGSQDSTSNQGAYQQGRFLVVKNDIQETQSSTNPTLAEHQEVSENTYQQGRFQIKEIKPEETSNKKEPSSGLQTKSTGPSDHQKPDNYPKGGNPEANAVQKGRFLVVQNENNENFSASQQSVNRNPLTLESDLNNHVHQQANLNIPLPAVAGQKVGRPPQRKTIASELTKISEPEQEVTHDVTIRKLLNERGIDDSTVPSKAPASASSGTSKATVNPSDEIKKLRSGSGGASGLASSGNSKQIVAAAVDPHGLQELCSSLTLGSQNLIMEYNALKSKNHILSKQLAETTAQLKEMTLNFENLKSQFSAYKQLEK